MAEGDEKLFQKLIRGEENLHSGLSDWAKKQIDILKADGRGQNAQAFEALNKISDRALINKRPTRNLFAPSDTQNTSNSKSQVYNNKKNNSNLNESLRSEGYNDVSNKIEGYYTEEPKKPADYSDYFDKIKTGNDFLFLAVSKVFPEIQTYGKDPKLKSKIESYWKIQNKEKIKNKLEEIAENSWIVRNYPHIPVLLPEAIAKLDKKMNAI